MAVYVVGHWSSWIIIAKAKFGIRERNKLQLSLLRYSCTLNGCASTFLVFYTQEMLGNSLTGTLIVNLWGFFFFMTSSDHLHSWWCRSPFVLLCALHQPCRCFCGAACMEDSLHSLIHFFTSLGTLSVVYVRSRVRNLTYNFWLHRFKLSCKVIFLVSFPTLFPELSKTRDLGVWIHIHFPEFLDNLSHCCLLGWWV